MKKKETIRKTRRGHRKWMFPKQAHITHSADEAISVIKLLGMLLKAKDKGNDT